MGLLRIDRFLSNQNIASRREAKELLRAGLVQVNGETVRKADRKIDPERDTISVNGQECQYQEHLYLMLYKPKGVVSATEDRVHRTVLDLVPEELSRPGLFPAGRLDKDTTGFVLLTDDGDFAHAILAPKRHVTKTYEAVVDAPVSPEDLRRLEEGIVLKDGTICMEASFSVEKEGETPTILVVIREGKYHQIKRMFGAVGWRVLDLKRTQIGGLALDPALPEGECRPITTNELKMITDCNK